MITGDYNLIKNINRKIILEEIIKNKEISRADIAKKTGLNKVTVSAQVLSLLKDNLLNERKGEKASGKSGGKKPILLSLKKDVGFSLGIDLLAEQIKVIVTNLKGDIVLKDFFSLSNFNKDELAQIIENVIITIQNKLPKSHHGIIGVAIGVHGHTRNDGFIVHCDNLKIKELDIKTPLEEALNIPVNVTSINKLGIIAEKSVYNMKQKCVIYLNMSAGLGGSVVLDNKLLDGRNGLGGELGHMIINTDGRQCHCGNRGCWETYVCEKAFLGDLAVIKKTDKVTIKEFLEYISQKDFAVINATKHYLKYINVGINNILNIFNPDMIILHNRIIENHPELLDELLEMMDNKLNTQITFSKYKEDGGCIGGCYFNIMEFLRVEEIIHS